jgi:hypothetical protein
MHVQLQGVHAQLQDAGARLQQLQARHDDVSGRYAEAVRQNEYLQAVNRQLRYRLADFVNEQIKRLPLVQPLAKAALRSARRLLRRGGQRT